MNRIQLMGRLTRDPEVRYTQTGKAVASFSVAVNTGFGDNKRADFIDVVAWATLAESCGNTLHKGQLVMVDGRLQIRSYETQDGQKRRVAEVVANSVAQPLDSWERRDAGSESHPAASSAPEKQQSSGISSFGSEVLPDEDIPF